MTIVVETEFISALDPFMITICVEWILKDYHLPIMKYIIIEYIGPEILDGSSNMEFIYHMWDLATLFTITRFMDIHLLIMLVLRSRTAVQVLKKIGFMTTSLALM